MEKRVIGILAHVDAGKTTLSEGMLYLSGSIRKLGRVDKKDAFLDTDELERARGITIFSKQAVLRYKDLEITLLDTPGHVDFSAEMERSLQVLDYAILVISGADGVQGHTRTLWRLLAKYRIPVLVFVNKMDQEGTDREKLLQKLREGLSGECVDFSQGESDAFYENIAVCDEAALEGFLENGRLEAEDIRRLIRDRKLFPCFFGSALKLCGVEEFLEGIRRYTCGSVFPAKFGAKVFKIARDGQGTRLTFLKITGGALKVKSVLTGGGESLGTGRGAPEADWAEKVNQIRIYSGEKYEAVDEAEAGTVCAVTGLTRTRPGEGLGSERASSMPVLEPVLTYRIGLPPDCDARTILPKLRQLEEEEPELHIVWKEELQEIQAQIMGEVQVEILRSLIEKRFGVLVHFDSGNIVYKETISNTVEGVGHFEPLRHYAEVHLLMEPGEPGSGLQFAADCSEDELDRNWQRLILTHLEEKEHKGVLVGGVITDMKISLIAGRSHLKHTEGGDFRQATYRAVRQGLMQAQSVLLEPWYEFRLEVPENTVGRAMSDIEKMCGSFQPPRQEDGMAILTGCAPVAAMRGYQKEMVAYTKGYGRFSCTLKGYEPCHNAAEIIEAAGYDALRDPENPSDSVFCAHGAGFVVDWTHVKDYMHIEARLTDKGEKPEEEDWESLRGTEPKEERWLGIDEVDEILARTYGANRRDKASPRKNGWARRPFADRPAERNGSYPAPSAEAAPAGGAGGNSGGSRKNAAGKPQENYLLVDGYNVIYAWDELKELLESNVDGARGKLLDIMCNYQAMAGCHLIVVFDAYRVQGHETDILDYHNIHVVYTKEAETADQYIEKFAHENGRKHRVVVATSDGLEQIIIRGQGCGLLSARDLKEEIMRASRRLKEEFLDRQQSGRNYLMDSISEETARRLKELGEGEPS